MPDQDEIDRIIKESTQTKSKETKETKKEESKTEHPASIGVAEGEEPDSSNAYQNWTEIPESRTYETLQNPVNREAARRANVLAKQNEINAVGTFTKEEAERIKKGLDPAKAAEIDAQVSLIEPEEKEQLIDDINLGFSNLMIKLDELGRNEKREQLRSLRQNIQSIEASMDSGRA